MEPGLVLRGAILGPVLAGDAREINPRRGWRPLMFAQFGLSIADVNNVSLCRVDGVMAASRDA